MKNIAKNSNWADLVDDFISKLLDFENAVKNTRIIKEMIRIKPTN